MSLNSFIILIIISIFSFVACCQVKNVAILCCFRLFTTTNTNKDSNDLNTKQIQTHRRPFCMPKPDADLCIHVDLLLDKTNCGKSGLGYRASGPPGRRAIAGRGPQAAGPSGRRAAGPWRAVGRGPLGRGPAFSKTHLLERSKNLPKCLSLIVTFYILYSRFKINVVLMS